MAKTKTKPATDAKAEWSVHCASLLRERARWLDDYEHKMLNDNMEGGREPTETQREFAVRIAYETEEVANFQSYTVLELIRLAQSCVAELPSFEEEQEILALAKSGVSRVSRRMARRLHRIAKNYAV